MRYYHIVFCFSMMMEGYKTMFCRENKLNHVPVAHNDGKQARHGRIIHNRLQWKVPAGSLLSPTSNPGYRRSVTVLSPQRKDLLCSIILEDTHQKTNRGWSASIQINEPLS